nr:hypothetical protein [Tanacetum cinerariifolium]
MAEKAHSQKLKDVCSRLTYREDTKQETKSALHHKKRKMIGGKKKELQKLRSPAWSRSIFFRLGSEERRGRRRRSMSQASSRSTSVFSRLGAKRKKQRRKYARELIRSYVTCSSERQRENEQEYRRREWDSSSNELLESEDNASR